jgi:hypothetical protein
MKIARPLAGVGALCLLLAVSLLYARVPARSFDLQDSPATVARPGADITDTYLFPSPANPNNVVVVMNVHPKIAPGQGLSTFFDQQVLYTMKFDNNYRTEATNARPLEDLVLQFSFGPAGNGTQQVFAYGPAAPNKTGTVTSLVNGGNAAGVGFINRSFSTSTGVTVFAGARKDPFFFDLNQFYNILPDRNYQRTTTTGCMPSPRGNGTCAGFNAPGSDAFAGYDVLSIVAELPKSMLAPSSTQTLVAYWATTSTSSGN